MAKDKIVITLQNIHKAIAAQLKEITGVQNIYDNPLQQGLRLPAWFINHIPLSGIDRTSMKRYIRTLDMDLHYVEEFNQVNQYDSYYAKAEALDFSWQYLNYPYTITNEDGTITNKVIPMYCNNREWFADETGLHYRFGLNLMVTRDFGEAVKMQVIQELHEYVVEQEPWGSKEDAKKQAGF